MTLIRKLANGMRAEEDELIRRVNELASREHRSTANMLRVLLGEALEAREAKQDPTAKQAAIGERNEPITAKQAMKQASSS